MIGFRRYFILGKRLVKRLTYVALLIIIPIAVLLLKVGTKEKGHVMSIGIYAEDEKDKAAKALIKGLSETSDDFLFTEYEEMEEAVSAVEKGVIDEAWIIHEDLSEEFLRISVGKTPRNPITIYIRETGVTHFMMQEVLESAAFKIFSKEVFSEFVKTHYEDAEGLENFEKEFYKKVPENSLFAFSYLDGTGEEDVDYLLLPVRGLLAILLLITGIAASVYYLEDEKHGLFIYWHTRTKNLRAFGYYAVVMFFSTVLVLASLYLAGVGLSIFWELMNIIIYDVAVILLSMIIRMIFSNIKTIGVIMPLAVIASIILSPVFIDMKSMRAIQIFVPSFHYLMSTHSSRYTGFMVVYCVAEILILEILAAVKRKYFVK